MGIIDNVKDKIEGARENIETRIDNRRIERERQAETRYNTKSADIDQKYSKGEISPELALKLRQRADARKESEKEGSAAKLQRVATRAKTIAVDAYKKQKAKEDAPTPKPKVVYRNTGRSSPAPRARSAPAPRARRNIDIFSGLGSYSKGSVDPFGGLSGYGGKVRDPFGALSGSGTRKNIDIYGGLGKGATSSKRSYDPLAGLFGGTGTNSKKGKKRQLPKVWRF
jgi:hypothetical protein